MTREQLLSLPKGTIIHHKTLRGYDSLPLRARVNGKVRLWKRDPDYFELPMKHGLRNCFYITPETLNEWEIPFT